MNQSGILFLSINVSWLKEQYYQRNNSMMMNRKTIVTAATEQLDIFYIIPGVLCFCGWNSRISKSLLLRGAHTYTHEHSTFAADWYTDILIYCNGKQLLLFFHSLIYLFIYIFFRFIRDNVITQNRDGQRRDNIILC